MNTRCSQKQDKFINKKIEEDFKKEIKKTKNWDEEVVKSEKWDKRSFKTDIKVFESGI